MSKTHRLFAALLLCLASLFAFSGAHADTPAALSGGVRDGGGGDIYSQQFVQAAHDVYSDCLRLDYLNRSPSYLSIQALSDMIAQAQIDSTDSPLVLNGAEKDALNYPAEKRIVFNRGRWDKMTEEQKRSLALHEYFGLLGWETDTFDRSVDIFSRIAKVAQDAQGFVASLQGRGYSQEYRCHVEESGGLQGAEVVYVDFKKMQINYITSDVNALYDIDPDSRIAVDTSGNEYAFTMGDSKDLNFPGTSTPWIVGLYIYPHKGSFDTVLADELVNSVGGTTQVSLPAKCEAVN